jgi:hypothetical protein
MARKRDDGRLISDSSPGILTQSGVRSRPLLAIDEVGLAPMKYCLSARDPIKHWWPGAFVCSFFMPPVSFG